MGMEALRDSHRGEGRGRGLTGAPRGEQGVQGHRGGRQWAHTWLANEGEGKGSHGFSQEGTHPHIPT